MNARRCWFFAAVLGFGDLFFFSPIAPYVRACACMCVCVWVSVRVCVCTDPSLSICKRLGPVQVEALFVPTDYYYIITDRPDWRNTPLAGTKLQTVCPSFIFSSVLMLHCVCVCSCVCVCVCLWVFFYVCVCVMCVVCAFVCFVCVCVCVCSCVCVCVNVWCVCERLCIGQLCDIQKWRW